MHVASAESTSRVGHCMERRVENGGLHQCSNKDSLKSVFFQAIWATMCLPNLQAPARCQVLLLARADQVWLRTRSPSHDSYTQSSTQSSTTSPSPQNKTRQSTKCPLTIQLPPYSPHRLHPRRAHITLRPPRMLTALCLGDSTRPPILARDMRTVMPAPYALVVLSWVFSPLTPEQQQASREAMVLPMGIEEMNRAADEYWYLSREQRRVLALLQGD